MKMLAPLIPHTIEEVYQHSIGIDQLAPPSNNVKLAKLVQFLGNNQAIVVRIFEIGGSGIAKRVSNRLARRVVVAAR
jgi:isoleucyl-tRNA synthetase